MIADVVNAFCSSREKAGARRATLPMHSAHKAGENAIDPPYDRLRV